LEGVVDEPMDDESKQKEQIPPKPSSKNDGDEQDGDAMNDGQ
jgi:hypothetical protein